MRFLILTQKVDKSDPVLGFFHRWIEEFAKRCERVTVICLEKGEYALPPNVSVYSLGKEEGNGKLGYILNFYTYIWRLRKEYDRVFVHMNQEYVILGGKLWKLWGKKIWLWRNHAKGGLVTRSAVWLSDRVFCTSPDSYTAKFKKTELMPVGIDTDFFFPDPAVPREPQSILFLGRIAPVKRVLEFVDWLKGQDFKLATIAGGTRPEDRGYEEEVRRKIEGYGLEHKIRWVGPVGREEARRLYRTHEVYVNFTPPGSFDKTIFEAAACGARLVTKNPEAERSALEKDNSLEALMKNLLGNTKP
jgi:glycosyltransferase involved in cell wall biosynthesis